MQQFTLGTPVIVPFLSTGLQTGLTTFPFIALLNGVPLSPVPTLTFAEMGLGGYTFSFSPSQTGTYSVIIQGQIVTFEVVALTTSSALQGITDGVLGSWAWDKTAGTITAYTSQGTTLATYTLVDTPNQTTKQRTS